MGTHVVTYDLLKLGQNYDALLGELRNLGGKRILLSTWLLNSQSDPEQIRDHLGRYIDSNDRLFVAEMDKWAWNANVMSDPRHV